MPIATAIGLGISGLSALGNLLGNRNSQQQTSGSQSTNSNNTTSGSGQFNNYSGTTNTSTPILSPLAQSIQSQLGQLYMGRLGQNPSGIVDAGITQGIQGINRGADTQKRLAGSFLAAKGLNYSPVTATTNAGIDASRIQQGNQLMQGRNLAIEQLLAQRLTDANNFLRGIPMGQQTVSETSNEGSNSMYSNQQGNSTTNQQGTVTNPGNMAGGGTLGLAEMLARFFGQGAFGGSGGIGGMDTNVARQP